MTTPPLALELPASVSLRPNQRMSWTFPCLTAAGFLPSMTTQGDLVAELAPVVDPDVAHLPVSRRPIGGPSPWQLTLTAGAGFSQAGQVGLRLARPWLAVDPDAVVLDVAVLPVA
jgi:hypothetical protein